MLGWEFFEEGDLMEVVAQSIEITGGMRSDRFPTKGIMSFEFQIVYLRPVPLVKTSIGSKGIVALGNGARGEGTFSN